MDSVDLHWCSVRRSSDQVSNDSRILLYQIYNFLIRVDINMNTDMKTCTERKRETEMIHHCCDEVCKHIDSFFFFYRGSERRCIYGLFQQAPTITLVLILLFPSIPEKIRREGYKNAQYSHSKPNTKQSCFHSIAVFQIQFHRWCSRWPIAFGPHWIFRPTKLLFPAWIYHVYIDHTISYTRWDSLSLTHAHTENRPSIMQIA